MLQSIRQAAAAVAIACTAANALAQPAGVGDEIVVTATRTARTVDETLAAVTVITRQEIERQQARSVQELLRGVPGVSIANSGGAGKVTSVFLRGTESDHLLVLVDGVKIGSATAGTTAFQDLPVELIERIEIVRGPRSSLYGSEAIGGVIQIFTRRGGGELRPSFSIGAGSHKTYTASANLAGGGERSWFSIGASGFDSDGFNACRAEAAGTGGCFTDEPDRDGYRNVSGSLRAGRRFAGGAELDVHALQTRGRSDFDGSFVNQTDTAQQAIGSTLRFSPAEIWRVSIGAATSRDDSDNLKDVVFQSRFDTKRDSYSLQNDFSLGGHLLTVGADYQDDRIASSEAFAVTARDNTGVFAQYQGSLGDHDLQASLRSDDNEKFGRHDTGNLAWGRAIGDALRLTAAYGTAFRAPSFNELYFPGFSNANLRPETARSGELGIAGKGNHARWSLNAYETRIDDLIAFDIAIFAPNNIDAARIRGLEAIVAGQLAGWDGSANLTLLDAENRSPGASFGKRLPRRTERTLQIDLDRDFGAWRAGAALSGAGRRYDDLANARRLSGYALVELRAEYRLARDWRLQGRVENLFDRAYETVEFYNQAGRAAHLTLRYQR